MSEEMERSAATLATPSHGSSADTPTSSSDVKKSPSHNSFSSKGSWADLLDFEEDVWEPPPDVIKDMEEDRRNSVVSWGEDSDTVPSPLSPDGREEGMPLQHHRPADEEFLCEWELWFDEPTAGASGGGASQEEYEHGLKSLGKLNKLSEFDNLWETMEELPVQRSHYFNLRIFRDGITPSWEDPENQNGGKWTIRMSRALRQDVWKTSALLMLREGFSHVNDLCGAVFSCRPHADFISFWGASAADLVSQEAFFFELRNKLKLARRDVHEEYHLHKEVAPNAAGQRLSGISTSAITTSNNSSSNNKNKSNNKNSNRRQGKGGGNRGGKRATDADSGASGKRSSSSSSKTFSTKPGTPPLDFASWSQMHAKGGGKQTTQQQQPGDSKEVLGPTPKRPAAATATAAAAGGGGAASASPIVSAWDTSKSWASDGKNRAPPPSPQQKSAGRGSGGSSPTSISSPSPQESPRPKKLDYSQVAATSSSVSPRTPGTAAASGAEVGKPQQPQQQRLQLPLRLNLEGSQGGVDGGAPSPSDRSPVPGSDRKPPRPPGYKTPKTPTTVTGASSTAAPTIKEVKKTAASGCSSDSHRGVVHGTVARTEAPRSDAQHPPRKNVGRGDATAEHAQTHEGQPPGRGRGSGDGGGGGGGGGGVSQNPHKQQSAPVTRTRTGKRLNPERRAELRAKKEAVIEEHHRRQRELNQKQQEQPEEKNKQAEEEEKETEGVVVTLAPKRAKKEPDPVLPRPRGGTQDDTNGPRQRPQQLQQGSPPSEWTTVLADNQCELAASSSAPTATVEPSLGGGTDDVLSRLSGASKIAYQLRSELEAGRAEEREDADPSSAGTVGNSSPSKPDRSSTPVRKSSPGLSKIIKNRTRPSSTADINSNSKNSSCNKGGKLQKSTPEKGTRVQSWRIQCDASKVVLLCGMALLLLVVLALAMWLLESPVRTVS